MYYHYGSIFWNAGVLSTQALSDEEGSGGGINYPKVTKAIYNIKTHGCEIEAPKINFADSDFGINPDSNTIYFALSAIPMINNDDVEIIKANRPYRSLQEFVERTGLTSAKIVNLIKAGCFGDPIKQMVRYAKLTTTIPAKLSVTQGKKYPALFPKRLADVMDTIGKIKTKENSLGKKGSASVYRLPEECIGVVDNLEYGKFWWQDNNNYCVTDKGLDKVFKEELNEIKSICGSESFRKSYTDMMIIETYKKITKGNENIKEWEFDTTSYYHNGNIFNELDMEHYGFVKFSDMPKEAEYTMQSSRNRSWRAYTLYSMPVTVIGRNDSHHTVFGLTADDEVVTIKFSDGEFAHYKKKTETGNWFERGSKIVVHGYRNGDNFRAKKYSNSPFEHTVYKIKEIKTNGNADILTEKF